MGSHSEPSPREDVYPASPPVTPVQRQRKSQEAYHEPEHQEGLRINGLVGQDDDATTDFTIEELEDDALGDIEGLEVREPDEVEEMESDMDTSSDDKEEEGDRDPESALARRMRLLRCDNQLLKARRQRKLESRRRTGNLKRTYSQSLASDTEHEESEAQGMSAKATKSRIGNSPSFEASADPMDIDSKR